MNQKIKLLFISDDIRMHTGVGVQASKLLQGLIRTNKYNIVHIGTSMVAQPPNPIMFGLIKIYPVNTGYIDAFQFKRIFDLEKPQITVCFSDPRFYENIFNIDNEIRDKSRLVLYHTWDNDPFPDFNLPWYSACDKIVMISKFSHELMLSGGVENTHIPHGGEPFEYYPISQEDIEAEKNHLAQQSGANNIDFIIFWNNKNLERKRPADIILNFLKFHEIVPTSLLIAHTAFVAREGTDLEAVNKKLNKNNAPVVFSTDPLPSNKMNLLYNMADVSLNIAYHEGFGLCVAPETKVYTEKGVSSIRDILIGDLVLTHKGTYNKVLNKSTRGAVEESISIYPQNFTIPTIMSLNDKVFAIKAEKCFPGQKYYCYHYCSRQNLPPGNCKKIFEGYNPSWITCTELKKGDIILYPKIKNKEIIIDKFDLLSFDSKLKYDKNYVWLKINKKYPRFIPANEEVFLLLGYYLAEGSYSKNQIEFAFNSSEKEYIADVILLMRKYFGQDHPVITNTSENCTAIRYSGKIISKFFSMLGHKAPNKELPRVIYNAPNNLLKMLLKGYWRGDGNVDKYSITFNTSSQKLAYQLFNILNRWNIFPSFRRNLHKSYMGNRLMYHISSPRKYLFFIIDTLEESEATPHNIYWQDTNYFYVPIRKIKRKLYEGEFIDIMVEKNHSFVAEGLIIHNCIMESLLTETPVIATKTGGMTEQMTDGENVFGELIEPSCRTLWGIPGAAYIYKDMVNNDDVVKALLNAYNNKKEWKEKGKLGREHILNNFHIDKTISLWDNFLNDLIKTPSEYKKHRFFVA